MSFFDSIRAHKWVTAGLVALVVAAFAFAGVAFYLSRQEGTGIGQVGSLTAPTTPPAIKFYCPLDGTEVQEWGATRRRPVIVQVDNAPDARPQTGLSQADIVYEAMAEGDVTRFSAIYACREVEEVGPVRSARLIDLELVPEYDALLANSGSSQGVTAALEARPDIPNIVHSNYPDAYWRVGDRYAPHNLLTSTAGIREAAAANGISPEASLKGPTFKDDAPKPTLSTISIPYSGVVDVSYQYDAATNRWLRFIGGEPHVDVLNGDQIAAKNVIIQFVNVSESDIIEDEGGNLSLQYQLVGSGRMVMFRDGTAIEGQWFRGSETDITLYLDSNSKPLPLNRGQIWVQLVPVDFQASWG